MSRSTSPYIFGEFWLDKRKDGRSPDIWQIASYNPENRSLNLISTKKTDLEDAKRVIRIYAANLAIGRRQLTPYVPDSPLAKPVLPALLTYWEEHGRDTISASGIAVSLRAFQGFLAQDEVGLGCTFDDIGKKLIARYQQWRMSPHEYEVEWNGKRYSTSSAGVCGATFKRNFADLRAALYHAVENGVVPHLRRLPRLSPSLKSAPRTRVLSEQELGAMIAYAEGDLPLKNWLRLMLATGCRPVVATKLVPAEQFKPAPPLLNLQPENSPLTKKRNPLIPIIPELAALLDGYSGPWVATGSIHGLRRRWRRMIAALGLGPEVVTKTIRHTVASYLEWNSADPGHISQLLGHTAPLDHTNSHKIYSPRYMSSVRGPLSQLWNSVHEEAGLWLERYTVATLPSGGAIIIERERLGAIGDSRPLRAYDVVPPERLRLGRTKLPQ